METADNCAVGCGINVANMFFIIRHCTVSHRQAQFLLTSLLLCILPANKNFPLQIQTKAACFDQFDRRGTNIYIYYLYYLSIKGHKEALTNPSWLQTSSRLHLGQG